MKVIKPPKFDDSIETKIRHHIQKIYWDEVFAPMFKILNIPTTTVLNSNDVLKTALKTGVIYFKDDMFYAQKRFGAAISKELDDLGAKYIISKNAYKLSAMQLPTDILKDIAYIQAQQAKTITELNEHLSNSPIKKLAFANAILRKYADQLVDNIVSGVTKSLEGKKIPVIEYKLTPKDKEKLKDLYVESLDFSIQKWSTENTIKMRQEVAQMALKGQRAQTISRHLQSKWGQAKNKANFIARQETSLFNSALKSVEYQKRGFTEFRWRCSSHGNVRPLHKELNGKIFKYDDLPIIDERAGVRGLPGQAFGCKCEAEPVISENFKR